MKRLLPLLLSFTILHAQTPFSTDSALSYLKTISVTIGARPMGSPNERKAMEFGLAKFREFGLTEAYLMNMSVAKRGMTHSPVNTNSGTAVGVLRGKTNRIIVIGGHMDSAGPDIPGANDDGSGAASVIELARVLSKENLQSTIVFCLFGGEEAGLCGSSYFVQNFMQLDSVALMLEIDMANGSDVLIPTIDNKNGNTPIWLVKAAYEEFGKLGYSGLEYPTHFFTLMSAMPEGGVGSDHEPFLEKNIPAIDFTSDINDPIHTPQDDFEHFKPSGLKRSGDLVYALVHRFDIEVPPEKIEKYFLFQIGSRALFFPLWLLSAFIIAAIVLSIYAIIDLRRRRIEVDKSRRPKVPALKLFLFAILIQTCVWLSENIVGLIKGVRYPWMANPEGYFVLGFLAALIGISFSLKLTPYINLSKDPYRWFLRTVIFLLIFISFMVLINIKAALYPSIALFFISLAIIVRKTWLKFLFWIVSPHFMFKLIFSEGFVFWGRGTALYSIYPSWMYFILHIFYILFFALWSFPFLLGFAAIYFESKNDLPLLRPLRTTAGLVIIAACFVICVIILASLPSYSDQWRHRIIIDQSVNLNTGVCKTTLKSSEYLRNLNVHLANKDTTLSGWNREIFLDEFKIDSEPWIHIERAMTTSSDSGTTFDLLTKVRFKYRPEKFSLSYSSAKKKIADVYSIFAHSQTERSVSLDWQSFPDTSLVIPIHFKVINSDSVTETIDARFIEMVEPIQIEKEFINIVPRSNIKRTELLRPTDRK